MKEKPMSDSNVETDTLVQALSGPEVRWVDSILGASFPSGRSLGDLATKNGTAIFGSSTARGVVIAKGCTSPGDGGGGIFLWEGSANGTDDGGTIIVPVTGGGDISTVGPYWSRVYTGPLSVKYFGAKGNASTTDKDAIQNAINSCAAAGGGMVYLPPGHYVCDDSHGNGLEVTASNISIVGEGPGASFLLKQHSRGDVFTIGEVRHVRFAKFGIQPVGGSSSLVTSGACFKFNGGGIFNAIEDIYTLHMWDFLYTSNPTFTNNNLRVSNVICDELKRFGAWLIGAIDPAIDNLWTFHSDFSQGACVLYDSNCDGLILTGALTLGAQYGFRSQNSVVGGVGPRALNASKCIMDNAGVASWSIESLSYSRFDGCFAATQQPAAMGIIIASDCYDLHWSNARVVNCAGNCVQINGARSISFVGGSVLACGVRDSKENAHPNTFDAISVGLTAKYIKIKGMDIGQDPNWLDNSQGFKGLPRFGVAIHREVTHFQIEGNNFIKCGTKAIFDNSGAASSAKVCANNLIDPIQPR
jgi:hypothetical protein